MENFIFDETVLYLAGFIAVVIEFIKPIFPTETKKTLLPFFAMVIGGAVGGFSEIGFVNGVLSGMVASGGYKIFFKALKDFGINASVKAENVKAINNKLLSNYKTHNDSISNNQGHKS